jgi:hypothetical protein
MNYFAHYSRLIDRARSRVLDGYCELHHVLPRCMGGDDAPSNLVALTAQEHFIAHLLLMAMHPEIKGLATAAMLMTRTSTNNKRYAWLRRRHAAAMRGHKRGVGRPVSQETRAKHAKAQRGKKVSVETRKKLSAIRTGKKMPPRSAEHAAKIWKARRANPAHPIDTVPVGKSGFRGVYLHKRSGDKVWQARIKINGREKSLGYYATPEEASVVAVAARAQREAAVVEGCARIPAR